MSEPDDYTLTPAEDTELATFGKNWTEDDWRLFENKLYIYAMVRGWLGDPMKQPPRVVLNMARAVAREKAGGLDQKPVSSDVDAPDVPPTIKGCCRHARQNSP